MARGYVLYRALVIIIVSEHSPRFAGLIGKRNPIATLIQLSYAKLLSVTITALSFAILDYPGPLTKDHKGAGLDQYTKYTRLGHSKSIISFRSHHSSQVHAGGRMVRTL